MGGFFGAVSKRDVTLDIFFGVDYHSHLGTRIGGMLLYNKENGFQRQIHNIENTPFRTKFENDLHDFSGLSGFGCISDTDPQPLVVRSHLGIYAITTVGIINFRTKFENDLHDFSGLSGFGCISDTDPQPLVVRSHLGIYAITTVGIINNSEQLIDEYFSDHKHQFTVSGAGKVNSTELTASLINQKDDLVSGILHAQRVIAGSMTMLIITRDGEIIAARDRMGRLPVLIGRNECGYCVSFESFAYHKLGYHDAYELGSAEIVRISADGFTTLSPAEKNMRICGFLWTYYGYPNSNYEGKNVEVMRYCNGEIMAKNEIQSGTLPDVDFVAGVPDSGVPHAIGYANYSGKQFARPFVKYTPTWPRSFMPTNQNVRSQIAKMKQIPVPELIEGKKLLFVDDSIVRGTQLQETVDFLYESGAEEVHMRSACPPIMYSCKYLNFSRGNSDMDLLARRVIQELEGDEGQKHIDEYADSSTQRGQRLLKAICKKFGFNSLGYQSLDGVLDAIGIDRDKICTYCWNGRE